VVGNFAFIICAKDDHLYLMTKCAHSDIISTSYKMFIFPDGIRNAIISEEICSCFLRDFWQAYQKSDSNMSDIDYLKWLSSIPRTFSVFGKSSIDLINSLQNGKELPKIRDGLFGDFTYISCPTVPTDAEVQREYDVIFGQKLGRDPEIGDYFEGGSTLTLKN
jgi:hypothetical protein